MNQSTQKFKIFSAAVCLLSIQSLSAHGNHALDYHLEDVAYEDYSTWQTIRLTTKAGVKYSVERSQDLESWEALATFTGLGQGKPFASSMTL